MWRACLLIGCQAGTVWTRGQTVNRRACKSAVIRQYPAVLRLES
tara:strand:- start:242 stop:373 length:132 start_codon:yes stop_codon:yes gene_type:complete